MSLNGQSVHVTPRDDLARFLGEFVSDLGGAVTLTAHDEGWDLRAREPVRQPGHHSGVQPDLGDLSIGFGHLGRFDSWQCEELEDALEQAKLYVRGVASAGWPRRDAAVRAAGGEAVDGRSSCLTERSGGGL